MGASDDLFFLSSKARPFGRDTGDIIIDIIEQNSMNVINYNTPDVFWAIESAA